MIEKYKTDKDNIYLYINYDYEFASFITKKRTLKQNIMNFLNRIKFTGKKAFLIINGVLLCTLSLTISPMVTKAKEIHSPYVVYYNVDLQREIIKEISLEKIEEIKKPEVKKSEEKVINKSKVETNKKAPAKNNNSKTITNNTTKNNTQNKNSVKQTETIVTVNRSNGKVEKIELEEYLIGVVAAEMPASFNKEALKAQSLAARTYTLNRLSKGLPLTDTTSTQAYKDKNQLKAMWGADYNKHYNKVKAAVNETKGEYITYNGKYIDAVFHSTSNGKTEDAKNVWGNSVPYLKSVDSKYDLNVSNYLSSVTKEFNIINKILGLNITTDTSLTVMKNENGYVKQVKIGNNTYTGVEFRKLFGLRSSTFDIEVVNGTFKITNKGFGHGVGMSQYGANGMANAGYSYKDIIKHYYTGVKISK